MKYTGTINGKQYTFESEKKSGGFLCRCIELPQFTAVDRIETHAIEKCLNKVRNAMGQQSIKIQKKTKKLRKWVEKNPKKWWEFWK
jgi:hypothetical protein